MGGVMVIGAESIIREPSSNPSWDFLNSLSINALGKDI